MTRSARPKLPPAVLFAFRVAMVTRLRLCGTDDGMGLCDDVSWAVWHALRHRRLLGRIVYGHFLRDGEFRKAWAARYEGRQHFWVEAEGFVVDGTVRQFGRSELVLAAPVGAVPNYHGLRYLPTSERACEIGWSWSTVDFSCEINRASGRVRREHKHEAG